MDVAALVAWVVTALGGFSLLGLYVSRGGLRQQETGTTRLPLPILVGHFLLAAVGLIVWLAFVISDDTTGLAWTAFGLLVVVALGGFTMLLRWWQGRQALAQTTVATAPDNVADVEVPATVPAEQTFPVPLVALHGIAAVTTAVLVVIAAVAAAD